MQLIPSSSVRSWVKVGNRGARTPSSISSVCPHCNEKGVFSLRDYLDDVHRLSIAASSSCPGCNRSVWFWATRNEANPKDNADNPVAIYMHPAVRNYYSHPEFLSDLPEPLQRAFTSTVDALNSRNYVAPAVCARRTLEGIFKYLAPEGKRNTTLAKLIEYTKVNVDLAAPLTSLSHAIRDGGNLGAHFDMEKEPDELLSTPNLNL
ncbi:hypothetical protein BH24DEI2_BH24DEI2_26460 [soil metagenome]